MSVSNKKKSASSSSAKKSQPAAEPSSNVNVNVKDDAHSTEANKETALTVLSASAPNLSYQSIAGRYYYCKPVFVSSKSKGSASAIDLLCATGSVIRKVSLRSGEVIGSFAGHSRTVTTITRSGDDQCVISGSLDGFLIVWNHVSFVELRRLSIGAEILDLLVPTRALMGYFCRGLASPHSSSSTGVTLQDYLQEELYLVLGKRIGDESIADNKQKGNSSSSASEDAQKQHKKKGNGSVAVVANTNGGALGSSPSDGELYRLVSYDTLKQKIRKRVLSMRHYSGMSSLLRLPQDDGEYIVAAGVQRNALFFWSVDAKVGFEVPVDYGQVCCLRVCPTSGTLVTAHPRGELVLWHDVASLVRAHAMLAAGSSPSGAAAVARVDAKATCTKLHWHAHTVTCLEFIAGNNSTNANGTASPSLQLLSAGEEGVLVLWHLQTHDKVFVPRLGAKAVALAVPSSGLGEGSEARVAVALGDNSLRVVSLASLREEWAMRGASFPAALVNSNNSNNSHPPSSSSSKSAALVVSAAEERLWLKVVPKSGEIASNGAAGRLQFLDTSRVASTAANKSASAATARELVVVPHVRVSRRESTEVEYAPKVTLFDFGASSFTLGARKRRPFMCSVDVRMGEFTASECSLKFWDGDVGGGGGSGNSSNGSGVVAVGASQEYALVAQVDRPHGSAAVTAMVAGNAFQSNDQLCITGAADGSIKIWRSHVVVVPKGLATHGDATGDQSKIAWSCVASLVHRNQAVAALALSRDGSVFASLSAGGLVSLFDPLTLVLKASLDAGSAFHSNADDDNSSQLVSHLQFVEERADDAFGGGNGEAYLVTAWAGTLTVFDLLSLRPVWRIRDNITAVAVAHDDTGAISISTNDRHTRAAWIAVATSSVPTTKKGGRNSNSISTSSDGDTDTDTVGHQSNADGKHGGNYKVTLFGTSQNTHSNIQGDSGLQNGQQRSLASLVMPARVSALVFTDASLLATTADGEMLRVEASLSSSRLAAVTTTSAATVALQRVSGQPRLPVLPSTEEASSLLLSSPVSQNVNAFGTSYSHAKAPSLVELFGDSSDHLVPLSSCFAGFLRAVNRPKQDEQPALQERQQPKAVTSLSSSSLSMSLSSSQQPNRADQSSAMAPAINFENQKALFHAALKNVFSPSPSSASTAAVPAKNAADDDKETKRKRKESSKSKSTTAIADTEEPVFKQAAVSTVTSSDVAAAPRRSQRARSSSSLSEDSAVSHATTSDGNNLHLTTVMEVTGAVTTTVGNSKKQQTKADGKRR